MPPDLDAIESASLPAPSLAALADLRGEAGVSVIVRGDRAFVRWPAGSAEVLRRVLPIAGALLYSRRGGLWYELGRHLPTFDLPFDREEAVPLARAVTPEPVQPEPPDSGPPTPIPVGLVRDPRVRDATALGCRLDDLGRWAEDATTARLSALRGAWAGDRALILGRPLPPIPDAERYWGVRVLVPLGFRPEPDLPESALCRARWVGDEALLLLTRGGAEEVPLGAFRPLTRAGVRLATSRPRR